MILNDNFGKESSLTPNRRKKSWSIQELYLQSRKVKFSVYEYINRLLEELPPEIDSRF